MWLSPYIDRQFINGFIAVGHYGQTNVDSSCGELAVVTLLMSRLLLLLAPLPGMPGLTEPDASRFNNELMTFGVGGVAVAARTPAYGGGT